MLMKSNKMQQYADIDLLQNHSTCIGCLPHPSSGVHKTVTAASGSSSFSSSSFSSSSSALQLSMSFGLLSYFVPLLPLLRSLFPILLSHLSQIISLVVRLNIYFLSYSLLLALVVYYPSVRLSIIEHF